MADHAWHLGFAGQSPAFAPLLPSLAPYQASTDWPAVASYNADKMQGIRFVDEKALNDSLDYEARIVESGVVATREADWHDFFNMLTWKAFPRTKAALLDRQMKERVPGSKGRNSVQNMAAHFEECGVFVVTEDPSLLELIRRFEWSELFVRRRDEVREKMRVLVYGHGLYVKLLRPYPALTGHAILLDMSHEGLSSETWESVAMADRLGSEVILRPSLYSPQQLQPLPLMGLPGWFKANEDPAFYDDKTVFRPASSRRLAIHEPPDRT